MHCAAGSSGVGAQRGASASGSSNASCLPASRHVLPTSRTLPGCRPAAPAPNPRQAPSAGWRRLHCTFTRSARPAAATAAAAFSSATAAAGLTTRPQQLPPAASTASVAAITGSPWPARPKSRSRRPISAPSSGGGGGGFHKGRGGGAGGRCSALPRHYGPVELRQLPGRGRGLVAVRELRPGDLVLVALPVAVVYSGGRGEEAEEGKGEGGEGDGEGEEEEEEEEDDEGDAPPVEALARRITRGPPLSAAQRRLLALSYDGSAASLQACPDMGALLEELQRLDHATAARKEPEGAAAVAQSAGRNGGGVGSDGGDGGGLSYSRVLRLLQLNCFSEATMDPAAGIAAAEAAVAAMRMAAAEEGLGSAAVAAGLGSSTTHAEGAARQGLSELAALPFLRLAATAADAGSSSSASAASTASSGNSSSGSNSDAQGRWWRLLRERPGHTGLWTEHALMNHSCAPAVCQYVVGRAMVVRAVRRIRAGEEVCDSYLGPELAAPLQVRRAALQAQYGFTCSCTRCSLEQQLAEQVERQQQQQQLLAADTGAAGRRPGLPALLLAAWQAVDSRAAPAAVRLMRLVASGAAAGVEAEPEAEAEEEEQNEEGLDEGQEGEGEEDEGEALVCDEAAVAWVDQLLGAALAGAEEAAAAGELAASSGGNSGSSGSSTAAGQLLALADALDRLVEAVAAEVDAAMGGAAPAPAEHQDSEQGRWLQFCVSGALDLSITCRRVALMSSQRQCQQHQVQEGQECAGGVEAVESGAVVGAAPDWAARQERLLRARRLRLLGLAAAAVPGSAFHVDAAVEAAMAAAVGAAEGGPLGVLQELRRLRGRGQGAGRSGGLGSGGGEEVGQRSVRQGVEEVAGEEEAELRALVAAGCGRDEAGALLVALRARYGRLGGVAAVSELLEAWVKAG